jgi:pimeloyl-ACP methyl ester carboxylesterase
LWDRLAAIDPAPPTRVLAGADDARFAAEAARLVAAIGPNAALRLVHGAGHSPHLERPDEWLAALTRWLRATAGTAASAAAAPAETPR